MTLQEKVDYEYRRFYLDQMRTSRENIFAHSGEIECKKKIKKALDEMIERIDPETREFLLVQDCVLESAFRFLMDEGREEEDYTQAIQRWFVFIRTA